MVVGSIGSDLRMDYTAVGDTTNVAARMQQAGEPGRVTISEATHRLVRGYFETRSLGELAVKGKAEPVAAWEVVAARETRTRLEVAAERGLTPFVGRERELGLLLEAFERAAAGEGQVVFLVGEPGHRASRACSSSCGGGSAPRGDWHEGHCLSFGRAMAFHPLVDLLRRLLRHRGGGRRGGDRREGRAGPRRDRPGSRRPSAPYLRALLSVDPGDAEWGR